MEYTILVSHNGKNLFETQPLSTPIYFEWVPVLWQKGG